jgi:hypothetical protein
MAILHRTNRGYLVVACIFGQQHSASVKLNWKMFRLTLAALAVIASVGCGGLNGSYNVSPASFLIPGLGQVTPAAGSTNFPIHTVAAVE